ncbi:VBP1 [Symbiodinium sp. KB8]|nr:VBP1 [Symbiodinium sp. KB8]
MELHLLENRKRIQMKLPDLEKSLEVVKMLQAKKEAAETLSTRFNLSDNVYAQAKVEPDDRVCVWLGADVMLEYTYTEAEEMLTKRVADAKAKDAEIVEDLAWVRENKIIAEVNTSRTFNYDVRRRRAAGGSDGDAAAPKTVAVDA